MGRNRAEYMRSYRAAKAITKIIKDQTPDDALREARQIASDYAAKCNDLEAEVKHLKAELAKRPDPLMVADRVLGVVKEATEYRRGSFDSPKNDSPFMPQGVSIPIGSFNSRPFTPAPKKGK